MNGTSSFYDQDKVEFNFQPDIKMTNVYLGLASYYETYQIWDNYEEYFDKNSLGKIAIAMWNGHDFLKCYYRSITFTHLAFEYLLNDLLDACAPNLSYIHLKKGDDLISLIQNGGISSLKAGAMNINNSTARNRVALLLAHRNALPQQYQIDKRFHFLENYIDVLELLASLRNSIAHRGKTILNRYTYECLFVNNLLPLIREYINTENSHRMIERNLACGKNVIDEIRKAPLPENFTDLANYEHLRVMLRRINHFKELGRASYNNHLFMFEGTPEENKPLLAGINRNEIEEATTYGIFKQEWLGHYKIYKCPCCGTKALTTDQYWESTTDQSVHVGRAECSTCTYRIKEKIGEPKEFGIMEEDLFVYVKQNSSAT